MNSRIPLFDPTQFIATQTPSLSDLFQRQLSYVRLSITDLCNFSCSYCLPNGYQGKKQPDELTLEEIEFLAAALARLGIKKIRITGGEPTLRKDLTQIIAQIHATKGIEQVALTTNGYRLAELFPAWRQAGLTNLNISVDSFDPLVFQQITGSHLLPDILRAIDHILADGFSNIKLNTVLMQQTFPKVLEDALAFIKERSIAVRFIELMQTGDHHELFKRQHMDYSLLIEQLNKIGFTAIPRGKHDGPAIEYVHPEYAGRIGLIAPYRPDFCESCNRVRVSSMGKVHLCLYDDHAYSIRPLLKAHLTNELDTFLAKLMNIKPAAHHLLEGRSGLIAHLAQIGG